MRIYIWEYNDGDISGKKTHGDTWIMICIVILLYQMMVIYLGKKNKW